MSKILKPTPLRILLTGGGSGGHIFPLIAVAKELAEVANSKIPGGVEFLFIGPNGKFNEAFRKVGIPAKVTLAGKIRRYFSFLNFVDVLQIPVGLIQAYWNIFWFMPDIVFAKGGYGSIPPVLISWIFRIPVVVHESDIVPGLANRILSYFARIIILSFKETIDFFPAEKVVVLGNPVRDKLFTMPRKLARNQLALRFSKPALLIMGGSQGAREINDLVLLALPGLTDKYEVIHQCGEADYQRMKKGALLRIRDKAKRGLYHPYPNLDENKLASAYSAADIIISRAGSGAIFEIAASGKPAILIPYKPASGKHQEKNAHTYEGTGAAVVLEGENLKPHILVNTIDSIMNDPGKMQMMSESASKFTRPDAARKIVEILLNIVQKNG